MAENKHADTNAGAGIDLSQFYQVFFEEAGENMEQLEQKLLELDVNEANDEDLNAIFRCARVARRRSASATWPN